MRQLDPALFLQWGILEKGPLAVDFFFILSGFLLTYLAIREYQSKGDINIRSFYKRRILRIFPLYYLAVIIGFLAIGVVYPLLEGDSFFPFSISDALPYYLAFLPNWIAAKYVDIGPIYGLWSIGVEEQFYLLFPLLVVLPIHRGFLKYSLPIAFTIFLAFYIYIADHKGDVSEVFYRFVFDTLRFHFILWGCLLGTFYVSFPQVIMKVFQKGIFQLLLLGVLLYCLWDNIEGWDRLHLFTGLIFSLFMISVTLPSSKINLEYRPLIYLGTISYGIYIFHPYVSILVRYVMSLSDSVNGLIMDHPWILYICVISIGILIAHLSYTYYERYFLDMKNRQSPAV